MSSSFDKSNRHYELSQERKEAYGKLYSLLERAGAADIHSLIGLPDKIRTRALKEVPNYRVAVSKLLRQTLENAEKGTRELIEDVLAGIAEVDRIDAELKSLEDDPNGDPDQKAA